MSAYLDLLDYRRRVLDMYRGVRSGKGVKAWEAWVKARDDLFSTHPQSPVEDQDSFTGLAYFEYDPSFRVLSSVSWTQEGANLDLEHNAAGTTGFQEVGTARFAIGGREHMLRLLWLDGYGGGLFLPFRDPTNGDSTYGGGRYLLDTVKGADLGVEGPDLILDFNYSYHPSCVHSPRWSCPLAPPGNRLEAPITAGERLASPNLA